LLVAEAVKPVDKVAMGFGAATPLPEGLVQLFTVCVTV